MDSTVSQSSDHVFMLTLNKHGFHILGNIMDSGSLQYLFKHGSVGGARSSSYRYCKPIMCKCFSMVSQHAFVDVLQCVGSLAYHFLFAHLGSSLCIPAPWCLLALLDRCGTHASFSMATGCAALLQFSTGQCERLRCQDSLGSQWIRRTCALSHVFDSQLADVPCVSQ